jgi:uncharacterized protein (DUF488 family)
LTTGVWLTYLFGMAELFTLGYEDTTLDRFMQVLRSRKIDVLVDVRDAPISRKPGFSKTPLSTACEAVGINYEHWQLLGCPRAIRQDYKEDGDWKRYTLRYRKHLEGLGETLENLGSRVLKERICLVCFEADHRFCHRTYIAEAVQQLLPRTALVIHLAKTGLTAVKD